MRCFECNKGKYSNQIAEVTGEVRGERFTVSVEAQVCGKCGSRSMTDAQSSAYTIVTADAYRDKHGLLTSRELKMIRSRLGLSQRAFAAFLRVGEASVKRWEAGLIQDESHDELIRLKTDLGAARSNVARLEVISSLAGSNPPVPPTG